MEKDRRAAIARPGGHVPVEHQADIVNPVLPLHLLMARFEWRLDQPVVIRIGGLIAPQHVGVDALDGQRCREMAVSFAAPETVEQPHGSNRRRPIAFPLDHGPAATADRGGQGERAKTDDGSVWLARRGTHHER